MITTTTAKLVLEQVSDRELQDLKPSPENDRIYKPIDPDDPDIHALADSIIEHGLREPLVITEDDFILSGHRRAMAAQIAGLSQVPCRVEPIRRRDDPDKYLLLLREYNRQRNKTFDEKLRESVIEADPEEAYTSLLSHRRQRSEVAMPAITLRGTLHRCRISKAKEPFLDAAKKIINDMNDYWPLSVRQIHYGLLNAPPLIHAAKVGSRYANDKKSYRALADLLIRARLAGYVDMAAISDDTRPVTCWKVYPDVAPFMRDEVKEFLGGYHRDLMASQPCHIELLAEKNTIHPIVKRVAMDYCIPVTSGRGFSSLPPRTMMAERFRLSGKDKLVLLVVSDFDPDGEEIAHSFARSMRDDFGIENIHPIKVALTFQQSRDRNLPMHFEAKPGSPSYKRFTEMYGTAVAEVEALPAPDLEQIIRDTVDSVIDHDLFEMEVQAERMDAVHLAGVRNTVAEMLLDITMTEPGNE